MRPTLLFILLCLCISLKGQITLIPYSIEDYSAVKVSFSNDSTGYMVWSYNTGIPVHGETFIHVHMTTDGGMNWQNILPYPMHYSDVGDPGTIVFVETGLDNSCYFSIIPPYGTYFMSTLDGGQTMNYYLVQPDKVIRAVHNAKDGSCFIVGVQNSDGEAQISLFYRIRGEVLDPVFIIDYDSLQFKNLFFHDSLNGMIIAKSPLDGLTYIMQTDDGGHNFDTVYSTDLFNFKQIDFASDSIGFIGTDLGYLLNTQDGGKSWDTLNLTDGTAINDIDFIDSLTGFCAGAAGKLFKTVDAGASWIQQDFPSDISISRFWMTSDTTGYIFNGLLYRYLAGTESGIHEDSNSSIYPNPVRENLYIESANYFTQPSFLEIFNFLGKRVLIKEIPSGSNKQSINLSELPGGMYLAVLYNDREIVSSFKFIKI